MMNPTLSILTPSVPSRIDLLRELMNRIRDMTVRVPFEQVEHLVVIDNKRRTVGEKREALLRIARGQYVAFVDDDDWVSGAYVFEILKAAESNPDVITFRQRVEYNDQHGEVEFRLGNPNEQFKPGGVTKRNAWHVCAWRRSLAIQSHFPAINYGEDWAFAAPLCAIPNLKEVHIPLILHSYRHSAATTEAPPPA